MQQNCYLHRIIVSMYAVSRELPLAHLYFGFLSVCAKLRRAFRFQPPTIERGNGKHQQGKENEKRVDDQTTASSPRLEQKPDLFDVPTSNGHR